MTLTAIVTAGESTEADRLLGDLRTKLISEMPILNQRACGGDWPEGWNYGPYTLQSFATMLDALRGIGEDWTDSATAPASPSPPGRWLSPPAPRRLS